MSVWFFNRLLFSLYIHTFFCYCLFLSHSLFPARAEQKDIQRQKCYLLSCESGENRKGIHAQLENSTKGYILVLLPYCN
ncbi:hypothetical protein LI328DRAFT_124822 [Trichoderma asperelloides]|nr:hypothetical protein LI328DRAFT_124822 [Trichoderma asperelloides]